MSLQGSLDTFALPDVLVLLASTKKDGELQVTGGRVAGKIWCEKGQIVHSDVNGKEASSVDAVFELLRLEEGTFSFEADKPAPARHDPETIDVVLADAQVRLGEWREIAKVVPHLDVLVDMAEKAPRDEVTITSKQWKLLRTVAGGSSVASLMDAHELTEFDACQAVKELFEADLISLDLSAKPKPKPAAAAAPAPAGSGAAPAEAPSGIQKRPADLPSAGDKTDDKASAGKSEPAPGAAAAAAAAKPDSKRVEEVKSEVEKELAALVDQASAQPSAAGAAGAAAAASKPKVRATTSSPGAISDVPEPPIRNGAAAAAAAAKSVEPKPEETKALVAQLAALEGENEEKIAKKVEEHLARGGELPEVGEGDEPINRGLLLKFLSSVRN
ncbi:MAG TPA: DUF4388 domain-containing protein [Acidimicrobiales bacterium]|nr:DUF4388 domain-containing protein [Acidimicrobiales bacterium]